MAAPPTSQPASFLLLPIALAGAAITQHSASQQVCVLATNWRPSESELFLSSPLLPRQLIDEAAPAAAKHLFAVSHSPLLIIRGRLACLAAAKAAEAARAAKATLGDKAKHRGNGRPGRQGRHSTGWPAERSRAHQQLKARPIALSGELFFLGAAAARRPPAPPD